MKERAGVYIQQPPGYKIEDHFVDINDMVGIGGGERESRIVLPNSTIVGYNSTI